MATFQNNLAFSIQNEDPDDEDSIAKTGLAEAQETAGFYEPEQRLNLGGLFNHLLFFSTLGDGNHATKEPQGKLKEAIDKHFTDFNGLKEAFKKVI